MTLNHGSITPSELGAALEVLGVFPRGSQDEVTRRDVGDVFRYLDQDKDGSINFMEFYHGLSEYGHSVRASLAESMHGSEFKGWGAAERKLLRLSVQTMEKISRQRRKVGSSEALNLSTTAKFSVHVIAQSVPEDGTSMWKSGPSQIWGVSAPRSSTNDLYISLGHGVTSRIYPKYTGVVIKITSTLLNRPGAKRLIEAMFPYPKSYKL
eukprot:CAMPEP_0167767204 /NCGR_PEP_ID=MMETSP0110_2-20121227/15887_1 /TAXON_ID=629695 /ORGANISM="Gymnochlora sp., Strain CCMP2014" /LENGTH=208 /DNA_ID=CAMNT_0007655551 /DNA_START=203 /DNA_END=826 /DNA_ORIENTATION=+